MRSFLIKSRFQSSGAMEFLEFKGGVVLLAV